MPLETTVEPALKPGTTRRAGLTYEEFLQWDGANQHVEWVDGEVIEMSPVSKEHSDVGGFLYSLLRNYTETKRLGRVFHDPFQMKTGPNLPGRAPDIMFIANASLPRLKRLYLDGPADLVVEIISPGSRGVDRGDKYYEYEQGGVPEYWLIDPDRKQAEFYRRGADGIYQPAAVGAGGIYHCAALPGVWIKVDWLWQEPLPPLLDVLREWKVI